MRRPLFVLLACGVVFTAGCDGYTRVKGHVLDPSGKPIVGAVVNLIRQNGDTARTKLNTCTSKTDEQGKFDVGTTHAPSKTVPFTFEVSKEGFVTHSEKVVGTADYEKEITLQPEKN
jgi:hypothetical protein